MELVASEARSLETVDVFLFSLLENFQWKYSCPISLKGEKATPVSTCF